MKIVRFKTQTGIHWGLLDEAQDEIREIAGGLRAWAPRVANGEGVCALPCNGRRHRMEDVELLAPIEDDARIFESGGFAMVNPVAAARAGRAPSHGARERAVLGVAIIGAPLAGRQNPLRSVFGYAAAVAERAGPTPGLERRFVAFAPVVDTRESFGDGSPDLGAIWTRSFGHAPVRLEACADRLAKDLLDLDAVWTLRPGDVLLTDLSAAPAAVASPPKPESAAA
ncbi:MAG TPA: DUF2437 domain-containing protein [Phenylobacterium sp.]|nr:DUF2437 domain-containing protein [Phenylobacterium sp.]